MTQRPKFESFLADEVSKVKGVYYPLKAGFLRMAFVRSVSCSKLHPNPNDEFCDPEIGPSFRIISDYAIRRSGRTIRSSPAMREITGESGRTWADGCSMAAVTKVALRL